MALLTYPPAFGFCRFKGLGTLGLCLLRPRFDLGLCAVCGAGAAAVLVLVSLTLRRRIAG